MRSLHPARIVCASLSERLLADVAHPLATAGFAAARSTGAPDAVALAAAGTDVLIVDGRLATSALLRAIRDLSARTSVAVVGTGGPTLADATLAAPVDPESLLAVIRMLVRLARARAAARSRFRAWHAALDALHDGVCLRDHEDAVLRCNPAFAEALGSTPLATAGRRISQRDLLGDAELPGAVQVRDRWFRATLEPVCDDDGGEIAGTMLVLADDAARTLQERHREKALRDAADQQRERDEFLSVASHELRTPLTTVQLQVQALQMWALRSEAPMAPSVVREKLGKAEREVRRLIRLVAEILDSAKLERGRIELHAEETDLGAIVREVAQRMTARFAGSGSRLTVDALEPVVGYWDKGRMQQVVTNLLMNACLYGRGRPVDVRVCATNARACLEVRDQGIGIAAEDQERIFKRFARATNDRSLPGFGVGLWSARRILEAMGGEVRVESEPGVGSTFMVELPLAPACEAGASASRG